MKIFLIFCLLACQSVLAQPLELRGKVYLINSGHQFLPGVQISADHSNTTQSDGSGNYLLDFNNDLVSLGNYQINFRAIYKDGFDVVEPRDLNGLYYNPLIANKLNIYMCPRNAINEAKIKLYNISTRNYLNRIKKLELDLRDQSQVSTALVNEINDLKAHKDAYLHYAEILSDDLAKWNLDEVSGDLKAGYYLFLAGKFDSAIARMDDDNLNRRLGLIDSFTTESRQQTIDIVNKKKFIAQVYFAKNKTDSTEFYLKQGLDILTRYGLLTNDFLHDYVNYYSTLRKYATCASAIKRIIPLTSNLQDKGIQYLNVAEYYSLQVYDLFSQQQEGNISIDSDRLETYLSPSLRYNDTARKLLLTFFNRDSASAFYLGKALYIQCIDVFCNEQLFASHQDDIPFLLADAIQFYSRAMQKDSSRRFFYIEYLADVSQFYAEQTIRSYARGHFEGDRRTRAGDLIEKYFGLSMAYYHNVLDDFIKLYNGNRFDTIRVLGKLHRARVDILQYSKASGLNGVNEHFLNDDLEDNRKYLQQDAFNSMNYYQTLTLLLKLYGEEKRWDQFDSALKRLNVLDDSISQYYYIRKSVFNITERLEIAEHLPLDSNNIDRINSTLWPLRHYSLGFALTKEDMYARYLYIECFVSKVTWNTSRSDSDRKALKEMCKSFLTAYGKLSDKQHLAAQEQNVQRMLAEANFSQ